MFSQVGNSGLTGGERGGYFKQAFNQVGSLIKLAATRASARDITLPKYTSLLDITSGEEDCGVIEL